MAILLVAAACEQGTSPGMVLSRVSVPAAYGGTGWQSRDLGERRCNATGTASLRIDADGKAVLTVKVPGTITYVAPDCGLDDGGDVIAAANGTVPRESTGGYSFKLDTCGSNGQLAAEGEVVIGVSDAGKGNETASAHVVCRQGDGSELYTIDADMVRADP
jgi:hypothetical protein